MVAALLVFLQMMWWVVSPWNVYTANPDGPTATASCVLTGFTANIAVGTLVTWTPLLTFSVNDFATAVAANTSAAAAATAAISATADRPGWRAVAWTSLGIPPAPFGRWIYD